MKRACARPFLDVNSERTVFGGSQRVGGPSDVKLDSLILPFAEIVITLFLEVPRCQAKRGSTWEQLQIPGPPPLSVRQSEGKRYVGLELGCMVV